jgi:hypothetical protein
MERTDKDEPRLMKSNTLMLDPRWQNARRDIALPRATQSREESPPPTRMYSPTKETDLAPRVSERSESDDPRRSACITDKPSPNLAQFLTERELPRWVKSMMEAFRRLPQRSRECTLNPDPTRRKERMLIELPRFM